WSEEKSRKKTLDTVLRAMPHKPEDTKNVIWKFVLPFGRMFFVFHYVRLPVIIMALVSMEHRKLIPITTLAIAGCLLLLPACRKHHRVARTPPPPQPSSTA